MEDEKKETFHGGYEESLAGLYYRNTIGLGCVWSVILKLVLENIRNVSFYQGISVIRFVLIMSLNKHDNYLEEIALKSGTVRFYI